MRRTRGLSFVISFSLSLAVVSSSASAASSDKFKDCTKLLEKYFWGVGLNRVAVADGYKIIEIRPKVYMANKRLDVDKDGVACEDESVQYRPAVTTTTTSSTTTTTTLPIAPNAPTLVAITMKTPFDGTGVLTWTDNSNNEDNFYISSTDPVKLAGLPLTSIWYKASKNQTTVTPNGMLNGYNYCFWGMASNAFGNSPWSGPVCSVAGTATTTTTAYVPPTTASTVPSSGSSSTSNSSYSISGYVGSSNVSLTNSWNSFLSSYSISGYVGSSYVSLTSSWNSFLSSYSISGYVGSSYVSLTSSWNRFLSSYSTSGNVGSSYVSATSSWNRFLNSYSISGSGTPIEAAILAAVIMPAR
jgi:hypothetical protein